MEEVYENYNQVWKMQIVLREFVRIEPVNEFRAFVFNGKLTAVSQYLDICFFEWLKENKQLVKEKLFEFFSKEVKDRLPVENCVIDFAIVDSSPFYSSIKFEQDTKSMKLKIIELNPFYFNTGASLYNWDHDISLLKYGIEGKEGVDAVDFRVIEASSFIAFCPILNQISPQSIGDRRCKGFTNVREQIKKSEEKRQEKDEAKKASEPSLFGSFKGALLNQLFYSLITLLVFFVFIFVFKVIIYSCLQIPICLLQQDDRLLP